MNPAIANMTTRDIDRFWSYVDIRGNDECWPWLGCTAKEYGQFSLGRKNKHIQSNQVAAFLFHGAPDPLDLYALHACDNRPCCNGLHLFYGTNQDNQLDASSKGLSRGQGRTEPARGMAHGRSKVTDEQVRAIRSSELNHFELSALYGLSQSQISNIVSGRNWRHIL